MKRLGEPVYGSTYFVPDLGSRLLAALGQRKGRQVFMLPVEELMMASVLAAGMEISPDELRAMRVRCIKDVKRTNSEIGFEDAVRLQEALEQDA